MLYVFVPGVKVIRWNSLGINQKDDLSMRFSLDAKLMGPSTSGKSQRFVDAFCTGGYRQDIFVRGELLADLEEFARKTHILSNSRLVDVVISGPEGVILKWHNFSACTTDGPTFEWPVS